MKHFFSIFPAFVRNFPARTCIQVAKLPLGALVEIEAIALVGEVTFISHFIRNSI